VRDNGSAGPTLAFCKGVLPETGVSDRGARGHSALPEIKRRERMMRKNGTLVLRSRRLIF
jgi:hypothetical protein